MFLIYFFLTENAMHSYLMCLIMLSKMTIMVVAC
jgi:hypothetical protein